LTSSSSPESKPLKRLTIAPRARARLGADWETSGWGGFATSATPCDGACLWLVAPAVAAGLKESSVKILDKLANSQSTGRPGQVITYNRHLLGVAVF